MAERVGKLDRILRKYAVLWSSPDGDASGRLEVHADRFELTGKSTRIAVLFSEIVDASIARHNGDRLRGLPVLRLTRRDAGDLRIASMEGAGALHELADFAKRL